MVSADAFAAGCGSDTPECSTATIEPNETLTNGRHPNSDSHAA